MSNVFMDDFFTEAPVVDVMASEAVDKPDSLRKFRLCMAMMYYLAINKILCRGKNKTGWETGRYYLPERKNKAPLFAENRYPQKVICSPNLYRFLYKYC